jgi:hypothetical protein
VIDGLKGFPEFTSAVYPDSEITELAAKRLEDFEHCHLAKDPGLPRLNNSSAVYRPRTVRQFEIAGKSMALRFGLSGRTGFTASEQVIRLAAL